MNHESTAVTQQLRLDNLPIEIIRRIIVNGSSCRSMLSCAAVNLRLRSICYEPLLVKELVETASSRMQFKPADWWDRAIGSDHHDTSLAARWALANELAVEIMRRDWANHMNLRTLEWLVPLLLVGHSLRRNLPSTLLGPGGYRFDPRTEGAATAAFFFAYQMSLSSSSQWLKSNVDNVPLTLSDHAVILDQLLGPFSEKKSPLASPIIIDESDFRRFRRVLVDEGSVRIHAQVMMGVGVFAPLVRTSRDITLTPDYAPPEASDIPFASLVRSPPPFHGLSDMNFVRQYAGSMVTSAFLEDGEWVGYYCHSMGLSDDMHPILDPEMKNIRFEVVGESPGGALLMTSSNGQDSIGNFNLWGSISSDTGLLMMFKSYQGGDPRWLWQGAMTPFGLAGTWGDESYGGWFWLWKRSWTIVPTS